MLMLPSAVTGISSKYSTPFESGLPLALDLSDLKFAMPPLVEQSQQQPTQSQQPQNMETAQPSAESPALSGLPRYAAQYPSAKIPRET